MKKGLTQIVFILDRSGSMQHMVREAIGGFNAFVEDQKKQPGEARMTLVQFDNEYEVVFADKRIQDVEPLNEKTYMPRATTALYDAIGKTINNVGATLNATAEHERPEHVIFVIMTDGMENASREYTQEHLKTMIEHQEKIYSWLFRYLAAGVDAQLALQNISSAPDDQVLCFAADGDSLVKGIATSSRCVSNLRSTGDTGSGWKIQ